jgi:CubicO group peptidase (beta-lactamase class C family)
MTSEPGGTVNDTTPQPDQQGPRMFAGEPVLEVFCRPAELLPSTTMPASTNPQPWPEGAPVELPSTYRFGDTERSTEEFLAATDTAAVLVLQEGVIRHEHYSHTGGPGVRWLSMSVAKSFVSALVGIALADGSIRSLDDPISDYITTESGSAYDRVPIRDVLQMSSGARWNEDYSDPDSDVFALTAAFSGVGSLDGFVAQAVRASEPGTACVYNSADTQALGSLLVAATGRSITDFMSERLCEPLGMTSPSHWMVDATGREAAYFGLAMTARDYARLGELYRNGGRWGDRQVVPAAYVADSVRTHHPHTQPGNVWVSGHAFELGYGYQWWLPDGDPGEFSAIGVYNQLVYVHPSSGAVVVKLSANQAYGTSAEEATNRDIENVAFLRAIARSLR